MHSLLFLSSGIFLGWSLGANDAAHVFGTAVSSRMIKYTTAIILAAIFIILGACLEGIHGILTLSALTSQNLLTAFIASLSAAISITLMTYLGLPISTSQAIVGSIIGIGFFHGHTTFPGLTKVIICWIFTPIGSMIISILLYLILSHILNNLNLTLFQLDFILRIGLVLGGIYGAYALGANNVANVVGVFANTTGLSATTLALIGGTSIGIGVLTYSKNVMYTVGKKLVPLNAFSALIAILGEATTVYLYAKIGVPVSTSQAIIGAVLGIGLIKGVRTININTLLLIILGWIATPLLAGILSYGIMNIIR